MPVISLSIAKVHLRIDDAAHDSILPIYIGGAERAAADYLNRAIFADQAEKDTALATVPTALVNAAATYAAAMDAASLIADAIGQEIAATAALETYKEAQTQARETCAGIIVNDAVQAAILLTLGDLFASREDTVIGVSVASLPIGARALMQPHRRGMGV